MGKGTGSKVVSAAMQKLPAVFIDEVCQEDEYVKILGRIDNRRAYKFIKRKYLVDNKFIDAYKLFIPEANGKGEYGEILTEPIIGHPAEVSSDTYLNAGPFQSAEEAAHLKKYLKSKLLRALLGVKKVTQHCPPAVWEMIPMQDFTVDSDIDWSQSVSGIDRQLYRKYGLDQREIEFIESHVKEME